MSTFWTASAVLLSAAFFVGGLVALMLARQLYRGAMGVDGPHEPAAEATPGPEAEPEHAAALPQPSGAHAGR